MATPFSTISEYLQPHRSRLLLSRLASAVAALALLALLPLLYLGVDLLSSGGRGLSYAALPNAKQQAFQQEWKEVWQSQKSVTEKLAKLKLPPLSDSPSVADYEIRRNLAIHTYLAETVSPEAAEAFFPYEAISAGQEARAVEELGLLGTAIRERGRWTGRAVATLARWFPWTWQPSQGYSANGLVYGWFVALALGILLLRGLMLNAASYLATLSILEAGTKLRREVYGHSQRLSAVASRRSEQETVGRLVSDTVEQVQLGWQADLGPGFRGPLLAFGLILVLLVVNTWLTLALLSLLLMTWLIAGQAAAWFRREARENERRAAARLVAMRESFQTMQLSKAYLMERFSQARFERLLAEHAKATWRRRRGETFSQPTLYTVIAMVGVLLLWLAGRAVLAGDLSIAGLVTKATTIVLLGLALQRWLTARADIARAGDAATELLAFLDRRGDTLQTVNAEFLPPPERRIEFHDVAWREPGSGVMVLEKVSFTIPVGSRVAIYADRPAATQALAFLLTRFIEPSGGEIKIDQKSIRWVTTESVRSQVALVLESALTFSDTITTNISGGDPNYTLPQIVEAAKIAHVHQFVQRLPQGYETVIGAGGSSLTVGERYRIALARAILRDPAVLILEEPTEPLDGDSLMLLDDTLARWRSGRTILILAKRPQTASQVDRVIHLQNGRVVDSTEQAATHSSGN